MRPLTVNKSQRDNSGKVSASFFARRVFEKLSKSSIVFPHPEGDGNRLEIFHPAILIYRKQTTSLFVKESRRKYVRENFPSPSKEIVRANVGETSRKRREKIDQQTRKDRPFSREKVTNDGRYFVAIYRFVSSIFVDLSLRSCSKRNVPTT